MQPKHLPGITESVLWCAILGFNLDVVVLKLSGQGRKAAGAKTLRQEPAAAGNWPAMRGWKLQWNLIKRAPNVDASPLFSMEN